MSMLHDALRFLRLPLSVQLLLVTQMLFNVGFYLVVPFLATYMTDNLAASGAMIGFILGLRTFSQQGLFFIGGGLTDRCGIKPMLLVGIAIRVLGFVVTGTAHSTFHIMVGVVLIGFAAALFSPAAETALAVSGRDVEKARVMTRSELFGMDAFFSRVGALTGPLLGAELIDAGFHLTCFVAAGIFASLFVSHLLLIPSVHTESSSSMLTGFSSVLRNRRFLVFALAYSTGLVAYNQQYLSLPVELTRETGHADALGWMFVFSSVFVLTLQMPLTRLSRLTSSHRAICLGFALMALGFAVVALAAPLAPLPGLWALTPAVAMLVLLHAGQMIAIPLSRDLVGTIGGEKNLGSYYGFLNSFGGVMVLLSSLVVGLLLDDAATVGPHASFPWLLLTVLLGASAVVMPRLARHTPQSQVSAVQH